MITFIKWLEQAVAAAPAPAATTTASMAGIPGSTTSKDIAPYLRPVGMSVVRRQYPEMKRKKRKRHKHNK